jgi:TPR repeat protein
MMRWGAGGPRDFNGALDWLRQAAGQGSVEARRLLTGLSRAPSEDADGLHFVEPATR